MGGIAGDSLYAVSFRSEWGDGDGPVGHLVVRRLDDHVLVAEIPAATEDEARALTDRAEAEVRGPAEFFERAWGIASEAAADPGPDIVGRTAPPGAEGEPRRGERIPAIDPRFTVFPAAQDVFVTDQLGLARLLHPLVSIELSAVDAQWRGRAHLLNPVDDLIEPDGDGTTGNWFLFRVDLDGCWRMLNHPRSAYLDAAAAGGRPPASAEAEAQFAGTKARWERYGALVWGDKDDLTRQREGWGTDIALVDQFGGDPGYGNWTAFAAPAGYTLDTTDAAVPVLRDEDGRPFTFVAATAGYPWRHHGADAILLFFEPETGTAALTFDWS